MKYVNGAFASLIVVADSNDKSRKAVRHSRFPSSPNRVTTEFYGLFPSFFEGESGKPQQLGDRMNGIPVKFTTDSGTVPAIQAGQTLLVKGLISTRRYNENVEGINPETGMAQNGQKARRIMEVRAMEIKLVDKPEWWPEGDALPTQIDESLGSVDQSAIETIERKDRTNGAQAEKTAADPSKA